MQRTHSQIPMRQTPDVESIDTSLTTPPPAAPRILTVPDVARELRCSKAHVHNLINGKVHGTQPLPSLNLGRRRLVRRSTLDEWIKANEHRFSGTIRSSPEVDAVDA